MEALVLSMEALVLTIEALILTLKALILTLKALILTLLYCRLVPVRNITAFSPSRLRCVDTRFSDLTFPWDSFLIPSRRIIYIPTRNPVQVLEEEEEEEEENIDISGYSIQEVTVKPVLMPLKNNTKTSFQYRLSLNGGQKYCRMLQGEHSAILSTFIKLPFPIKTFV